MGCYHIEVDVIAPYYDEQTFYRPGKFYSLNLTWDELAANPRVVLAIGCFEVISSTVYVHMDNEVNVVPLTLSTVPKAGETVRWIYFDTSTLTAEKFEGLIRCFDPNTGRYTVIVNRIPFEIAFTVIEGKPEPLIWLNGTYNRFGQVTRPRIIRSN